VFLILLINVATGCRTVRYANHYRDNLVQYSKLLSPLARPGDFGDSIIQRLQISISDCRQKIQQTTKSDLTYTAVGTCAAIIVPYLPIGTDNKKLVSGISVTGAALSLVDLFVTIIEPKAYDKKALEIIAIWDASKRDNDALTHLRASLLSLEQTWPAYAP